MLDSTLVDKLAPWPALQAAAAFVMVLVGLAVAWRTVRAPAPAAKDPAPAAAVPPGGAAEGVHLYFNDESWKSLFKAIDGLHAGVAEIAATIGPLRELVMSEARETRHDVERNIHKSGQASEADAGELRAAIARLQGVVDRMNVDVVRIEERTRGKAR